MKFKHTVLFIAMGGMGLSAATEAALTKTTLLSLDPAVLGCIGGLGTPPGSCTYGTKINSGSYFAMGASKVAISPGADGGIFIDQIQTSSGAHGGFPDGSENTSIDAAWGFFCNTGFHYTTIPITVLDPDVNSDGGFTQTLDMSGWTVGWSGIPEINIGDTGTITCSAAGCPAGSTYVLDYATTIPSSPLHSFGGVGYSFQITGTVSVPSFDVTADSVAPVLDATPDVIDVLTNDTRITTYSFAPVIDSSTVQVVDAPSFGTAMANVDGTITYDRSLLDTTSADSFTYTVMDDAGFTSSETTVTIVGTTPIVSNDSNTTENGSGVVFTVAANATDNTGIVATTVLLDTPPPHGSINNPGDGTLTYTPNDGFTGVDTFTVTIEDVDGNVSNPTTQSVTVNATMPGSDAGDFVAGAAATAAGNTTGGGLTAAEVGVDAEAIQQCVGGCVDFVINTLNAGDTLKVVVPLSAPIPANASYRKLTGGAWVDFVYDANSWLSSAPPLSSAPLVCPAAGDAAYVNDLVEGNVCLQITMTEGSANDADGVADGTFMDPGGIAVVDTTANADTTYKGGNSGLDGYGCSISNKPTSLNQHGDWWIVAGFIAFIGLLRRKSVTQ